MKTEIRDRQVVTLMTDNEISALESLRERFSTEWELTKHEHISRAEIVRRSIIFLSKKGPGQ